MKKLLSLILAVCMVISIAPAALATEATEGDATLSGVTVEYKIKSGMGTWCDGVVGHKYYKENHKKFSDSTYASTSGFWEFAKNSQGTDVVDDNYINWNPNGLSLKNAGWWAFKIYVPADGMYTPKVTYGHSSTGVGNTLHVSVVKADSVSGINSTVINNNKLTISGSNAGIASPSTAPTKETWYSEPQAFDAKELTQGEYYVIYSCEKNKNWVLVSNFVLDGTADDSTGTALMRPIVTANPNNITVGETTSELSATVYDNNGAKVEDVAFTYESLNPEIATVGDNVVTGVLSGTAEIKATATKDTMTSEGTTEIKVINPNASGVTVKYDLNAAFGLLAKNATGPVSDYVSFDTTNEFLEYVTDSRGDEETKTWRIIRANFGGKYVYMVYQSTWICLEVNVPVAGDYSVSMYNGLYRNQMENDNALKLGGVMDVYVFKNEGQTIDSSVISAASLIGQVDCSSDTVASTIVETPSVIKRDHSFDAGKYYIVLRTQDIETCNEFGIVGDIILDGGDGEVLMGNITLGDDELTTGVATTVTANGYSSKTGSALDVEDFVYSSSNPAVASVNGDSITINGAGKATISATSATYGRTITKDITVNDITEATFGYFINNEAMGSVTSSTGAAVGEVASIKLGTPVTLTAEAADGYEFKYWETPLGNKFGEEITFAVTSNMSCRAVFGEKPVDGNVVINFYNGNRDWLSTEIVAKNTLWSAISKPYNPSILGFDFLNWAYIKNGTEKVAEDTDSFAEDTNVVAKYSEDGNEVTYNGGKTAYGTPIEGETDGRTVKCWKRGDKIVSYAQEYTFFANGIADTITPVYEGEFIATPIAVLESYNGQYMLEYDVPAGYTKLEAGIIYGSSKDTLKVNSYYSKAVAKNEEAHGQFTAIPNGADAGMETVARGYVIYKTADGCIGVAYSD